MIAAVTGTLEARGEDSVVLGVGGVSLRVQVPVTTLETLGPLGSRVRLHTHLQVGEDAIHLYGFLEEAALRVFRMLLSVGGVGPRAALSILSTLSPAEVAGAIASEDTATLSRVPGIGKRTASRIILELQSKLEREGIALVSTGAPTDGDVVAALRALGYSETEARQALRGLEGSQGMELEERVRQALQQLSTGER